MSYSNTSFAEKRTRNYLHLPFAIRCKPCNLKSWGSLLIKNHLHGAEWILLALLTQYSVKEKKRKEKDGRLQIPFRTVQGPLGIW